MSSLESIKKYFSDEESKVIAEALYNRYIHQDASYILRLILENHKGFAKRINDLNTQFLNKIERIDGSFAVFGAGANGTWSFRYLAKNGYADRVSCFCDNSEARRTAGFIEGGWQFPVISVEEAKSNGYFFLVPQGVYYHEMEQQLLNMDIRRERIIPIPYTVVVHNDMVEENYSADDFFDDNTRIVLFGTSYQYVLFHNLVRWSGMEIESYADIDTAIYGNKNELMGKPIVNISETIKSNKNYKYVVYEGIRKWQLRTLGVEEESIIHLGNIERDLQYFDSSVPGLEKESYSEEVFIDGGSLDLATANDFLRWCNNGCSSIYAFEVDRRNLEICNQIKDNSQALRDLVEIIPKGLWSEESFLRFKEVDISGSSFLADAKDNNGSVVSETTIETTSVDKVLGGKKATFIKFDIEGSELEALKGAKETIKRFQPVLAVSIYHKPEDIVMLPQIIKEMNPEYKLYLRRYHEDYAETVLYAIP